MLESAEIKKQIARLPLTPGIYIYRDGQGKVLYVGKSVRLRDRVKSYFLPLNRIGTKTARLVEHIVKIDHIETDSEIEALLLEADLIKKYRPEFNTQWKDDKNYKYIKIENAVRRARRGLKKVVSDDRWPVVTTARRKDDPDAMYFGPFPEGGTINQVLKVLRRIFPWCQFRTADQARRAKKPCFYSHIGLCPGICSGRISLTEYWEITRNLIIFLKGKKSVLKKEFEKKMRQAAQENKFEKAAEYRDTLRKLDYVTQSFHDSHEYLVNTNLKQDLREEELRGLLAIVDPGMVRFKLSDLENFRIEGYDISNLGKKFTVASQVTFIGGESTKQEYRRYRIRHDQLPDDFAAMREVIKRRIKKSPLPDLFLIDGGKGQLSVVLGVIHSNLMNVPAIGLAKKFETIIVPTGDLFTQVSLPKDSPALKLLMRIRDEAHRFAQSYHKLLRKKDLVPKIKR
jgi:excinuclease ABC subunit C